MITALKVYLKSLFSQMRVVNFTIDSKSQELGKICLDLKDSE